MQRLSLPESWPRCVQLAARTTLPPATLPPATCSCSHCPAAQMAPTRQLQRPWWPSRQRCWRESASPRRWRPRWQTRSCCTLQQAAGGRQPAASHLRSHLLWLMPVLCPCQLTASASASRIAAAPAAASVTAATAAAAAAAAAAMMMAAARLVLTAATAATAAQWACLATSSACSMSSPSCFQPPVPLAQQPCRYPAAAKICIRHQTCMPTMPQTAWQQRLP